MGLGWAKEEWKELNETSKDLTPRGKVRLLSEDPRSPTGEISRTPIQVDQTPTRIASCNQLDEIGKTPPGPEASKALPSSDKPIRAKVTVVPDSLHRKIFDRHPLRPTNNRANEHVDKAATGEFMSAQTCLKLIDDEENDPNAKVHFD